MRIRITNHYRNTSQDYKVEAGEVREFFTEHFPWVATNQSLQEMLTEANDAQAYDVEVVDDVGKAESSGDVATDMLGVNIGRDRIFAAAFWLAGKPVDAVKVREARWQEDGDDERAALRAAGLDINTENLRSLKAVLDMGQDLRKFEGAPSKMKEHDFQVEPPHDVQPGTDSAKRTAAAVARGFKAGSFKPVNLGGKHSTNSAIVDDPETGKRYLLKPASGGVGPAAGIKEESASQARREAAFSHIAEDVFGLGNSVAGAELILLDGKEWAALDMLPLDWKNLDRARKADGHRVGRALNEYRTRGILHRWAVMDFVLGQADRHAGNLMISPADDIKLIDHGSAFAGPDFDPGHDSKSFVPYYLRFTVSTGQFNSMDQASKLSHMPVVTESADQELRRWIHSLDSKRLTAELQRLGMRPDACAARLELVKDVAKDGRAVAPRINGLWLST